MSIDDKTFFDPEIFLSGPSEHAARIFDVYELQHAKGKLAFESISTERLPEEKLAAIQCLSGFLDEAGRKSQRTKDDLLWQFFLATQIRFYPFAIEDTAPVSMAMSDLIFKLFSLAKDSGDTGVQEKRTTVIDRIAELAKKDYEEIHPGSKGVPNQRALNLLERIRTISPELVCLPIPPQHGTESATPTLEM
ncbi:MAG: hypothetical protein SFW62_06560 [Alphaproteobacteria bacterium]|nr:hypothetical protein [Alphaproteobacteria bacterium]